MPNDTSIFDISFGIGHMLFRAVGKGHVVLAFQLEMLFVSI